MKFNDETLKEVVIQQPDWIKDINNNPYILPTIGVLVVIFLVYKFLRNVYKFKAKESITSEFKHKYLESDILIDQIINDYYPFEEIIEKIKNLLGGDVFKVLESAWIKDEHDSMMESLYQNWSLIPHLCKQIANEQKLELSYVLDNLIFKRNDLKNEFEFPEIPENSPAKMALHLLFTNSDPYDKNTAASELFEEEDYDYGLYCATQAIFYTVLLNVKLNSKPNNYKSEIASFLDTFGHGLFLKKEYEAAVLIHDKSIELSPDNSTIAEHLTNRAKAKLKLSDKINLKYGKERAIEDLNLALKKDKDYLEAKTLLKKIR